MKEYGLLELDSLRAHKDGVGRDEVAGTYMFSENASPSAKVCKNFPDKFSTPSLFQWLEFLGFLPLLLLNQGEQNDKDLYLISVVTSVQHFLMYCCW